MELNKKLAEWAELEKVELLNLDNPYEVSIMHFFIPNEDRWGTYQPFTQSLDACFKWLVPKLPKEHKLYGILDGWLYEWCIYSSNKNPALTLCLEIEKLIDDEK